MTDDEREAASIVAFEANHADDELELDNGSVVSNEGQATSVGEDGVWVRCWCWIPNSEIDPDKDEG